MALARSTLHTETEWLPERGVSSMPNSRRRYLTAFSVLAVATAWSSGLASAADPTFQFDIPAESLSRALTDYSQVSSQQIFFTDDVLQGHQTQGLHGRYSAND